MAWIFDLNQMLPLTSAVMAGDLAGVRWGAEHKRWMRDGRDRVLGAFGIGQEIPMPTSRVTVSSAIADRWGMPAARFRKDVHWTSREVADALERHGRTWLAAAGVEGVVRLGGPAVVSAAGEHSCGTARMGHSATDSATRLDGRVHGTARIYACDSSLHPTNGSVNPTLTIIANCLRVADLIVADWPRG